MLGTVGTQGTVKTHKMVISPVSQSYLEAYYFTLFITLFGDNHMKGKELRFTLTRLGLTYKEFGELIGKSGNSVQRWISYNMNIGEKYLLPLRKSFSKSVFKQIEAEWNIHLDEIKQKEDEYLEYQRVYEEQRRLQSMS